ncbi:MAG: imidazole glycerol phosphate synthase subunit HisH, partial [Nitrososphaerota archaeon]
MMIAILDLGIGNLFSIKRSFERIGREAKICAGISELRRSDALVLPGVGNFSWSLRKLESIRGAISELILDDHVPVLGICLGMQLLFSASEEGPGDGLNVLP